MVKAVVVTVLVVVEKFIAHIVVMLTQPPESF